MNEKETAKFLELHPEFDDGVELDDYHELERQDFAAERYGIVRRMRCNALWGDPVNLE